MHLPEIISGLFHKNKTGKQAPPETCPVCWGWQEYDGKVRIKVRDKQADVNHHKKRYTQTKQFLIDYIDGAKLKEGKTIDENPP